MKRITLTLIALLSLVAIVLTLPFTPPGNRIIAGIVQQKLNETLPLSADVETFDLGFRRFSVVILLESAGRIKAEGEYSLFDRSLSARYRADVEDLASLSGQKMQGSLQTEGTVKGSLPLLEIDGHTDAAGSDTAYHLTLADFNPGALTATIRHARLEQLLALAGQAPLASGSIDAEILLHSIDPAALDGTVDAVLAQGTLDRALISSTYGLNVPDAALNASLQARLQTDTVTYDVKTDSALGHLTSDGTLTPQNGGMDIRYAFSIKELALLQGLTGQTLHGAVSLAGQLKGDREHLDATASGELAGGKGALTAVLKAYAPVSADVTAQHLRLARLLSMLGYPRVADADVSGHAVLPSLDPEALKGTIDINMAKGSADTDALSKLLGRPFPASTFMLKTQSRLNGENVATAADFVSDLFTLRSDTLQYNVKQSRMTAAYTAEIPDLSKLSSLAERPLRGSAKISGDLTYDDALMLHANSSLLKGAIAATLKGEALHADFKQISTIAALHMLVQPETFDARFDGTLDYRLDNKQGELKGKLTEGAFSRNNVFDLLRQYTSVDLYKERFDGTTLARLDDTMIDADLQLRSDRAALQTKHAKIDTAKETVRADIKLEAAGAVIPFRLRGKMSRPGVTVDAGKLIEQEAGKQVQQLFDSLFK
ncbi:hypothetical protein LOH54_08770 [Sulfurimonas sp. HSL-3221]|uniref:hypothetical protein n=1 Tax=Sulfurimonadaceae TaxID=2771471 RepID=UPI001E4FB186|nr:hypothetical protein [Sulfurimonas sp. HSL-3221]UFS61754.1 hypothetical protein LOH54_08770 [Sulfurimonas sp. HSL-3221]